jgi:hypothetical protein
MKARTDGGLAALAAVLVLFTAMLDPWASVILALALLLVELSIRRWECRQASSGRGG